MGTRCERAERSVGEAADVEDDARDVSREAFGVECGHERRSLASCGHVAGAQVRNDVDARELCDERGMVELQREALLRTMADRLAVHAECGDVGGESPVRARRRPVASA